MKFLTSLSSPGREFSPVPFWFLNGDLTDEGIVSQLEDFDRHGVHGVVLHPRMGLRDDIAYLSAAFFGYIKTAVKAASRLDVRVVLYDEGMYPSGSAGGQIVAARPDLASRGIVLTDAPLEGDRVLCRAKGGYIVERFSGGTLRGLHFGEDDGEANAPKSADILCPEAVDMFISLTHEAYYRAVGPYFGNTVIGFFTDEPSILGRCAPKGMAPWTKGFDEVFTRAGGRLEELEGLFTGEETDGVRLYRRLILERESQVYYLSLSRWCAGHGIALMGHPHQSDDIEVERYFHIPGQDLVLRWIAPEKGDTVGMDTVMAKCSADMAFLPGARRNANECFGACNRDSNPWYFTGGDMKWYTDYLAVRGVNMFIPHAFYYSLEGKRSGERPPDVGPGSLFWPRYEIWAAYFARLSWLMTDMTPVRRVAVLCKNRDLKAEAVRPLFERQTGFQYLPESALPDCRVEGGRVILKGQAFDCVIGGEDVFPEISHTPDEGMRDCLTSNDCPALRTARFIKDGRECLMLVNAGETAVETVLTVAGVTRELGAYDLWRGEAYRQPSRLTDGARQTRLRLGVRESLLLFAVTDEEYAALPVRENAVELAPPAFSAVSRDGKNAEIVYEAEAVIDESLLSSAGFVLPLSGEEVFELSVNGVFCDVSYWQPHRLRVPAGVLAPGVNRFRLTVWGSRANVYGKPVKYGLESENSAI